MALFGANHHPPVAVNITKELSLGLVRENISFIMAAVYILIFYDGHLDLNELVSKARSFREYIYISLVHLSFLLSNIF